MMWYKINKKHTEHWHVPLSSYST